MVVDEVVDEVLGLNLYILTLKTMFAIIKNNEIIWFSDEKITKKNMLFDKLMEWNFDTTKQYIFENWEVKENKVNEKQTLENEKEKILKELAELNWYIEWAKKLKEMWVFDEDDELELVWYETKAQELITKRAEIKAKIKELWN